jgi:hypothetical protein
VGPSSSDQPRLTRRRLLRLGIGSAIAVGVGGILVWHSTGYDVPDRIRRRLRALGPKELVVVEAIAERLLRSDGGAFPDPAQLEIALFVDGFLERIHPDDVTDLRRLLSLLEHVLPLRSGFASRFTRLDGAARDHVLAAMQTSSVAALRGAHDSLRSLCAMAYFHRPETWTALGYDGPLVGRPAGGWAEEGR